MFIRDRIRELRRVLARQLRPSPKNWRSHPPAQRDALQGLLAELGYCDALLVRELADGALELIDGHLRAETTPDVEVPVLVLDVTAEEAAGGDSTVLVWDLSGHYRDGRFIPVKRTQAEMNSLWVDLAEDSARAFRAVEALAATTPEQVVPFLKDDLRPEAAAEPRQVAGWIRRLDSDEFEVREDASRHLEKQGLAAVAALRQALAADPSPEVQRRLKKLLERLDPSQSPALLRVLRALSVLEMVGTPEARQVLEGLARYGAGCWLEEEAKESLQRLATRH